MVKFISLNWLVGDTKIGRKESWLQKKLIVKKIDCFTEKKLDAVYPDFFKLVQTIHHGEALVEANFEVVFASNPVTQKKKMYLNSAASRLQCVVQRFENADDDLGSDDDADVLGETDDGNVDHEPFTI